MPNYSKEQLWELYQDLPEELKEALFSEDVAEDIYKICQENKLSEKETSQIVKNIGYVFSGLLSPSEFKEALSSEVGIKKNKVKNIGPDIRNTIFLPLKEELEMLYDERIEKSPKKAKSSSKKVSSKKKDKYRESAK